MRWIISFREYAADMYQQVSFCILQLICIKSLAVRSEYERSPGAACDQYSILDRCQYEHHLLSYIALFDGPASLYTQPWLQHVYSYSIAINTTKFL